MKFSILIVMLITLLTGPVYAEDVTVGGSSYPYQIADQVDPWGFYTCECTSYAAWYWNSVLGRPWHRVAGYGDAWNWPRAATANRAAVSSTPHVGDIISWNKSQTVPYGHVAIVHKINDDGTIDVSEYSYISSHAYSYRTNVNPAAYGNFSYIGGSSSPVPEPSSFLVLVGGAISFGLSYRRRRQ